MSKVHNYNELLTLNREDNNIVIVRNAEETLSLRKNYPQEKIKIRLVLTSIDESLLDLLLELNENFEIVLKKNNPKEGEIILLSEFKNKTNNKVYVSYNIDEVASNTPYERAIFIYYINRYNIIGLLESKSKDMYQSWISEMSKYTNSKNIKRLNITYVGKKQNKCT